MYIPSMNTSDAYTYVKSQNYIYVATYMKIFLKSQMMLSPHSYP